MAKEFHIDEQVAQGLLKLLGHASLSMSQAREWEERKAQEENDADVSVREGVSQSEGVSPPASTADHDEAAQAEDDPASRRLFALLEQTARVQTKGHGASPEAPHGEARPDGEPAGSESPDEPRDLRPLRSRTLPEPRPTPQEGAGIGTTRPAKGTSLPSRDIPARKIWRRALILPRKETQEDAAQILRWIGVMVAS